MNVFRPVKVAFPDVKQSLKIPFLLYTERDFSLMEIQGAVSLPMACLDCVGSAEPGARLTHEVDKHLCF